MAACSVARPAFKLLPRCTRKRPSPAIGQHLEISARLRCLHDSEGVFLSGHRQFDGIVAGDLQKHSGVRATFVGLSRRVQESRAESQTGRHALLVAHQMPQRLQTFFVLAVHLDVAEHARSNRRP